MLAVGSIAPEFSLPNQLRQTVSLSAFHPLAFTPVCTVQMQTYERERPRLDALDAHVLSISNDAGPSKKAWGDALGGISYDLLSDYHPHGEVATRYGVLREDGLSERAIFLVDKAGVIRWIRLYQIPEQPYFDELLEEIRTLTPAVPRPAAP